MKEKYLLTIKAEEAPGVLARVLTMLSRRRIEMESVSMSKTDLIGVILISGEIYIDANEGKNLQFQLAKIIEVIIVHIVPAQSVTMHKTAFFKLSADVLREEPENSIQKYGAQLVKVSKDAFIISKTGSEETIKELYNKLDGKHLIGFAQSGVIADTPLLECDDEWRISKLAA